MSKASFEKEKLERLENEKLESERIKKDNLEKEKMEEKKRENDFEEQMQCVDEIISWTETSIQTISKIPSSFKIFQDSSASKKKINI